MFLALAAADVIAIVIFTQPVGKLTEIYHRVIDTLDDPHEEN